MFAPAEWEQDVPENAAHFPRIHKGKKNSLANADKAAVEAVYVSTKEKKNKHKKKKNVTTENIHKIVVLKDHDTSKTAPKRTHSAPEVKQHVEEDHVHNNGPPRRKRKRNKTIQHNLLEKLDETVIANKGMLETVKPNEVGDILFNKNRKEKSKEKIRNLLQTHLETPIKASGSSLRQRMTEKLRVPRKTNKTTQNNVLQQNLLEKFDETMIANKKNEMFKTVKPNEVEDMLFGDKLLRTPIKASGASLHQRMTEKLRAAQFRYLNEQLYVTEGKDAKELFESDPTSFKIYHDGFRQQLKKWPINPLDVIVKQISKMPKNTKIADMGCGEGSLARRVPQKVRSFDLVSAAEGVEVCDMAHTPLLAGEMDVAVYCLALMGTNLKEYLIEANRILKVGGIMKIAEVESRFKDVNDFIKSVECYGFKLTQLDNSHSVFFFITFEKLRDLGSKRNKLPYITLEPCLYKKR